MKLTRYKSYVLPVALVAGYLLRDVCASLSVIVPYLIFSILFLTFSGVKLVSLRPGRLDLLLAVFQAAVSIILYEILLMITSDAIIAQSALMCILCPVASSVTVVASMLGASPVRTTTYTIVGNMLVAVVAPAYITLLNSSEEMSYLTSFGLILGKISMVIVLPFVVMLIMQRFLPSVNAKISLYKQSSFYLWAAALFITIGQTADFVVEAWTGDLAIILWPGLVSLLCCILQFAVGRKLGARFGDAIAGGQLLGQKNTAMGIWMINTFLNPLASVAMAFYSIWQNLFNSWQIARRRV